MTKFLPCLPHHCWLTLSPRSARWPRPEEYVMAALRQGLRWQASRPSQGTFRFDLSLAAAEVIAHLLQEHGSRQCWTMGPHSRLIACIKLQPQAMMVYPTVLLVIGLPPQASGCHSSTPCLVSVAYLFREATAHWTVNAVGNQHKHYSSSKIAIDIPDSIVDMKLLLWGTRTQVIRRNDKKEIIRKTEHGNNDPQKCWRFELFVFLLPKKVFH